MESNLKYLQRESDQISFRGSVVIYLPNKKPATRNLLDGILRLRKNNQARCLDIYIEKPNKKTRHKPELRRAVGLCNERAATLIIPEIGQLTKSLQFLAEITALDEREFYAISENRSKVVMVSKVDISTLAMISVNIREEISFKTKLRLQELKLQGIQLGAPDPQVGLRVAHAASREYADDYARELMPQIQEIRALGYKTLTAIAKMLNARKVETVKGGKFHPTTVKNILTRAKYL